MQVRTSPMMVSWPWGWASRLGTCGDALLELELRAGEQLLVQLELQLQLQLRGN